MKKIFLLLSLFALKSFALTNVSLPYIVDTAAIPKVRYVDKNDSALKWGVNNINDTVNAATGTGVLSRSVSPSITTPTISNPTISGNTLVTGTAKFAGVDTFTTAPVFSSGTASQTMELTAGKALTTVAQTGSGSYVKSTSPTIATPTISSPALTGTIATPLTASRTVITDGSGNLSVNTETGSGSHVRATSPIFVTPILGVAAATRSNVNGATDVVSWGLNVKNLNVAASGGALVSFGVGDPSVANTERCFIQHTGTAGQLTVDKQGTGTYRDLQIQTNGSTQLTVSATSGVTLNTSVANVVTTLTGNTTLDATHHTINADATSGSFTITLPLASSCVGRVYDIHKTDFTLNTISITSGSGTDWSTPTLIGNANNSNISVKSIGNTWQYETYIDKGTWTATITGCTSAPTAVSVFFRIGNHVTIDIPILSATSNANTFTYTGVPSTLSPGTVHFSIPSLTDNSATIGPSSDIKASYNTSTITFYKSNSSTGFTTSGTKGTPVRFELEFMQ